MSREVAVKWLKQTEFFDDSFKNKRGHALVIAGSESYSGAAVLAGNAAMRSGVGLVTVVTPRPFQESVAARVLPEVMVRGVAETESGSISVVAYDELGDLLEKADSVAVGCGLSQDESIKRFVENVIENRSQPVIVDADALNLLSPFSANWPPANAGGSDIILTPHEGEFMRLLGTDDKGAIKDRVAAVRDFAVKNGVILMLKGERVLIGSPDGRVVVNPTGNSGLGKAGNGDTLAGILAGFVAQAVQFKIDIFETVVAAVYVAGMAGDFAEKKYGKRVMTASDVRECLTDVFSELES
jgi:NAD(P)H-hydrate epimerase